MTKISIAHLIFLINLLVTFGPDQCGCRLLCEVDGNTQKQTYCGYLRDDQNLENMNMEEDVCQYGNDTKPILIECNQVQDTNITDGKKDENTDDKKNKNTDDKKDKKTNGKKDKKTDGKKDQNCQNELKKRDKESKNEKEKHRLKIYILSTCLVVSLVLNSSLATCIFMRKRYKNSRSDQEPAASSMPPINFTASEPMYEEIPDLPFTTNPRPPLPPPLQLKPFHESLNSVYQGPSDDEETKNEDTSGCTNCKGDQDVGVAGVAELQSKASMSRMTPVADSGECASKDPVGGSDTNGGFSKSEV